MLTFELKEACINCGQALQVQVELKNKLADIMKKHHASRVYLAKIKVCDRKLKDLIYYDRILEKLKYNPAYYMEDGFSEEKIISKVKSLIV